MSKKRISAPRISAARDDFGMPVLLHALDRHSGIFQSLSDSPRSPYDRHRMRTR